MDCSSNFFNRKKLISQQYYAVIVKRPMPTNTSTSKKSVKFCQLSASGYAEFGNTTKNITRESRFQNRFCSYMRYSLILKLHFQIRLCFFSNFYKAMSFRELDRNVLAHHGTIRHNFLIVFYHNHIKSFIAFAVKACGCVDALDLFHCHSFLRRTNSSITGLLSIVVWHDFV